MKLIYLVTIFAAFLMSSYSYAMLLPEAQFQEKVNEINSIVNAIKDQSKEGSLTKGTYTSMRKDFVDRYNAIVNLFNHNPQLHNQQNYDRFNQIQDLNNLIKQLEPS